MNIRLISACSPAYKPLADITEPTKKAYAEQWGYQYESHIDPIYANPWNRPVYWKKRLEDVGVGNYIFFTGTDAAITNPNIPLEDILGDEVWPDLFFSVDHNGLQSDSFIMRSSERSLQLMAKVIALQAVCANEQDALQVALSGYKNYGELRVQWDRQSDLSLTAFFEKELSKAYLRCKVVPNRILNALPIEYYGGTGKEPHGWSPSSLILHMPGKDMEFRLKHFPEYLKRAEEYHGRES
jgi:hypothetical protein